MEMSVAVQDADVLSTSSTDDSVAITVRTNQEPVSTTTMLVKGVQVITNLMYWLQEFTVGVNLAFLVHVQQPYVLQCMEVLGDYVHVVAFSAACTW